MSDGPQITVVVVNYRTPDLAMRCMAALRRERVLLPSLTAVVVDGGSGDGSAKALEKALEHPDYRAWASLLPLALNGGYGWANNQAMLTLARQKTLPEFIHVLNPDTEVGEGAVAQLINELQANPRCGAAGSQLLSSDGKPAASAFRFPSPGREFIGAAQSEALGRGLGIAGIVVSAPESREVDWVTGASVMFRAEALRETGLFDDGFFLYFEEVELMHRLRACGWTVRHVPASRVVHVEGAATGVGAAAADRPLPPYWYRSRRRYFELTGGTALLIAANLSSLAGQAIAGLKRIAGRPPASKSYRAADLFRLGFWPSGTDARPSAPSLGDTPGRPPSWLARS
jgi:N-acetylglucosaminyl-diphospho-decaprenol L-rhamnosyltransferase